MNVSAASAIELGKEPEMLLPSNVLCPFHVIRVDGERHTYNIIGRDSPQRLFVMVPDNLLPEIAYT